MGNRKQFIRVESERLDTETGELQQVAKTVSYNVKVDTNFTKLHSGPWTLTDTLSHIELKLFLFMADNMTYENLIHFTGREKELTSRRFKVTPTTVKRAIPHLIKKYLILRLERGRYMVNPYLATKGGADRTVTLREKWEELNPGWNL